MARQIETAIVLFLAWSVLIPFARAGIAGINAPLYRLDLRFENSSYSPLFIVGDVFSDGSVRALVQFTHRALQPETYVLSAKSYDGATDYEWSERVTLQQGQMFSREIQIQPSSAPKIWGEYNLLFEVVDSAGRTVLRRPAAAHATPIGFLGLDSPPAKQFPYLPARGLVTVIVLGGLLVLLYATPAWRRFFPYLALLAVALAAFTAFAAFLAPMQSLGFIPVLDASVHTLKTIQLTGVQDILLEGDIHQYWVSDYRPMLAFAAASLSILAGTGEDLAILALATIVIFVALPLACFAVARRILKQRWAAFAAVALVFLGTRTLSSTYYEGFWAQALGMLFIASQLLCAALVMKGGRVGKPAALSVLLFFAAATSNVGSTFVSALVLALLALFALALRPARLPYVAAGALALLLAAAAAYAAGFLRNDAVVLSTFLTLDPGRLGNMMLPADWWNSSAVLWTGLTGAVLAIAAAGLAWNRPDADRERYAGFLAIVALSILAAAFLSSASVPYFHAAFPRLLTYAALFLPLLSAYACMQLTAPKIRKLLGNQVAAILPAAAFGGIIFFAGFSATDSAGSPSVFGVRQYTSNFYGYYWAAADPRLNADMAPLFFLHGLSPELKAGAASIATLSAAGSDIRDQPEEIACINAALATRLSCVNLCRQPLACSNETVLAGEVKKLASDGRNVLVFVTAKLPYEPVATLSPPLSGTDKTYYLYRLNGGKPIRNAS